MSSTFSNTGIELIGTGDQSGQWGNTTNTNWTIADRAINGVVTINLTGNATSLATSSGALSLGQAKVLVLGGTPSSGTNTVTLTPNSSSHVYFVDNRTSGRDVVFRQGDGTGGGSAGDGETTVLNGRVDIIYANGAGTNGKIVSMMNLVNAYGITASVDELNYNDITTLGTSQASKTVTADVNGDVNLAEELKAKSYTETVSQITQSTGTLTIDCSTSNVFEVTLSQNITSIVLTNVPTSGGSPQTKSYGFILKVTQGGGAGGFTVAFPASFKFTGGTDPVITVTGNAVDVFSFFTVDAGTNWYGFTSGQDLK